MDIRLLDIDTRPTAFIGVGFHAFFPVHAGRVTPQIERELHRRWRDLSPSFVRVTHKWGWNEPFAVRQLRFMAQTGTQVYLTTWNPEDLSEPEALRAYGDRCAAMLERLTREEKLDHIRWYCMTNELSLPRQWGALCSDMPRFEAYHRAIHAALDRRDVNVGLLASDASPTAHWPTIAWAAEHMADVSEAYGGHHYINDHALDDGAFYGWFRDQVKPLASLAHGQGKPFIIGEFGPKQHRGERYGFQRWDGCAYFDTPEEPVAAVQTVEAVIAAVNGGADAIGYWTFADFPDAYSQNYANKWGVIRWDEECSPRPVYFAVGLMTRFFRGPADVLTTEAPEGLRVLAVKQRSDGLRRVAVLNRRGEAVTVHLKSGGAAGNWDAWIFDPRRAGDYVQCPTLLNELNSLGRATEGRVEIPADSLVVLVEQLPPRP